MKPFLHAKSSAKKFGGKWEDYLDLHNFMDQTKASHPSMIHRIFLHNSHGIFIGEQVFGSVRTNSDGVQYSVRDVLEQHCLEDMGTIMTLDQIIAGMGMKIQPWLGGRPRRKVASKVILFNDGGTDGEAASKTIGSVTAED